MTDEQIFELVEKNGFQDDFGRWNFTNEELLDFVFMVQKAEREACAKLCDEQSDKDGFEGGYANECAELIRARGEK